MKLVGMGLEAGVPGVVSYLNSIKVGPGQPPPPMTVLRWWFTLNYDAVLCSPDRLAFTLRGQGVKVESENERLTAEGKQVHTGASDELNRQFARSFTEHFEELCDKYPDLRRAAEHLRAGAGRRLDPRRGRRRQGRLALDLLRRSAGLSGRTDRRAERSRFGRQLPGHRRQVHRGGRQRRRQRSAPSRSCSRQSIGVEHDPALAESAIRRRRQQPRNSPTTDGGGIESRQARAGTSRCPKTACGFACVVSSAIALSSSC